MIESNLLHFDPIEIAVLIAGFIGTWTVLKRDSKWHSQWIKEHDRECRADKKATQEILAGIREITGRLTTLSESHGERLTRIETHIDKE